jgi:alkylated DNA repair dioxygenase AlkB
MVVLQGSLFASGDRVGPRPSAGAPERTVLGAGAWVDVHRHWMAGADLLFERLATEVRWQSERRPMYDRVVEVPRLVAFYAGTDPLPDPALDAARTALRALYRGESGGRFASVGLCLYRDGRDSVAFHGDTIGREATGDTLVAIVSLGSPRTLLLRPSGGGAAIRFRVGAGDLLVMGGSCQRTWEHAVPKTARPVGPRISMQFRPPGVG